MKIYISVDMEGITGVTHWDEVEQRKACRISSIPRAYDARSIGGL